VAQRVGLPVYVLEEEMPYEELMEWAEVLAMEAEANEKAQREAETKARRRR